MKLPQNYWTKEQEQYVIENYGTMPVEDVADYVGMKKTIVMNKASQLRRKGYPVKTMDRNCKKWTLEDEKYIKENYGTMKVVDMAKELKVTPIQIYNKIDKMKYRKNDRIPTNVRVYREKISDEGLKLKNIPTIMGRKYIVSTINKSKKEIKYFEGKLIQETLRHITLENTKTNVRESFLKVDFLTGEYKLKEVI